MTEPMSEERLQSIRQWCDLRKSNACLDDERDMLAEIDRLRTENLRLRSELCATWDKVVRFRKLYAELRYPEMDGVIIPSGRLP